MADLGSALLQLARDAIDARLGEPPTPTSNLDTVPELKEPGATFVTTGAPRSGASPASSVWSDEATRLT